MKKSENQSSEPVGKRLKTKRQRYKLSAQQVASIIDVSKENIYKWEKGTTPRDPEEYMRLMEFLNEENVPSKLEAFTTMQEHTQKYGLVDRTEELIESLRAQISFLKEKCEGLEASKADLKLVVQRQAEMFGYLHALDHHLVRLRVKSEKIPEDQLNAETGNIVAQFLENGSVTDKSPKVGSVSKVKS